MVTDLNRKVYRLIFFFIVLTLCFGAVSLVQLANLNQKASALTNNYFPKSKLSNNLRIDLPQLQRVEMGFLLSDDEQERHEFYLQTKQVIANITLLIEKYEAHPQIEAKEAEYLHEFRTSWNQYIALQSRFLNSDLTPINTRQQHDLLAQRLIYYNQMIRDADELVEFNDSALLNVSQSAAKTYQRSRALIILAIILSMTVGTAVIIYFKKQISQQENLQRQAERDELTGLYNRRYLFNREQQIIRNSGRLSIIMADIDHFKAINDKYGHDGGDIALRTLSLHMLRSFRIGDVIVRYGGEEFVILLPDTPFFEAKMIAERLRLEVEKLVCYTKDYTPFNFTLSLGVIERHRNQTKLSDLLSIVDKYLYEAKQNGRNRIAYPDANIRI